MELRVHQRRALAALESAWAAGRERAWVVLPPGAGKTLVGLETARGMLAGTAGRRVDKVVVLSPNTAIQDQWQRQATALGIDAAADRDLHAALTSLTYQSVAVFDSEDEDTGTQLGRLHANGRALVETLRTSGRLLLVLDECHHLLEVWGELLGEVLALLPDATVLGLTATPPEALTGEEAALVDRLFGETVFATSIPAVVREGDLAPFADLVWLTTPTSAEREWLAASAERFEELLTQLTDADLGTVPFLSWLDRRFLQPGAWPDVARAQPDLATAALRAHHRGLLALPEGATTTEQTRRAPDADDWVLLIGDWVRGHLSRSEDERDEQVLEAIRRALPAVGYSLTRRGIRAGRSPVDRVLARSESKTTATVQILEQERRAHGDDMRLLVLADHERASATLPADLRGVLTEQSGSARALLATLCEAYDDVLMVTGSTVAGPAGALAALRKHVAEADPELADALEIDQGEAYATLTGPWTSRRWVRHVTALFEEGGARVLVGTRGLLGEGWDARGLTGVVDLTAATTTTAVVQLRGRSLRTDPRRPDKVAVNWTVVCVEPGHPRGENDYQRLVRKHTGFFGAGADGEIVDGVGHIDAALSPYAAPPESEFEAVNARMLVRAEHRDVIRDRWRIGEPYADLAGHTVRIRPAARTPALRVPDGVQLRPQPPTTRLHDDRLDPRPRHVWLPTLAAAATVLLVVALMTGGGALIGPAAGLCAALWGAYAGAGLRTGTAAVSVLRRRPSVASVAAAVADGLHATGRTSAGAEALATEIEDGGYRFHLDGVPEHESSLFATSLEEALAPVASPRYLVARPVPGELGPVARTRLGLRARVRAHGETWHPVPAALGRRAADAKAYANAFDHWVGGTGTSAGLVYTGSPEGAGLLAAQRGSDPFDVTAIIRRHWS